MIADLDDHLRSRGAADVRRTAQRPDGHLDGGPMTDTDTAIAPTVDAALARARWIVLALVVITVVAAVSTYLTAPRPGGRMDPAATSSDGAHALVALLRDHGVDVIVADDIAAVERAAGRDTLVVDRADEPPRRRRRAAAAGGGTRRSAGRRAVSRTREILAPDVRRDSAGTRFGGLPGLRPAGGHQRRGCAVRCERRVRGVRRRAGDAVLRRRGGPLHRRGPHRHRGRHRGLHDQLGAAEARATPRWR